MNKRVFGKESDDFSRNFNTETFVILERFNRGIFDSQFFYGLAILWNLSFILLGLIFDFFNFGNILFQGVVKLIGLFVFLSVFNKVKILERDTNGIESPLLIDHIDDINLFLLIILCIFGKIYILVREWGWFKY